MQLSWVFFIAYNKMKKIYITVPTFHHKSIQEKMPRCGLRELDNVK
jgi:hypothetical protein